MVKVVIVESPAKCKKIESYLGAGYKCIASFGHIRNLKGLKSIDIDNQFKPSFNIIPEKSKYIKQLREKTKKADEVILATDDDREGEAIAWHIAQVLKLPLHSTKRIIFHEITKTAIQRAIRNPTCVNMNRVYAQQARQVLDLLVGFTISPVLWKYINRSKGLSAGRCQTPALRIIYENQKQIDESPGEMLYQTTGTFTKKKLAFQLNHKHKSGEEMESFLEDSVDFKHRYSTTEPKTIYKKQPQPFTTSVIQQKASNEFNYSPKQTMRLCQKLYEKGLITYMRTDSKTYSKDFIETVKEHITKNYCKRYISSTIDTLTTREQSGKNVQEAHEAIRTTDINRTEISNTYLPQEIKMYHFIWRNTLESCMPPAEFLSFTAYVSSPNNYKYTYRPELIQFPGWKIVAGYEKTNPVYDYLLELKEKKLLHYHQIYSKLTLSKLTTHYTEARLVQALEKHGIARPSTFSSIIAKIQERGYVQKQDIEGKEMLCSDYQLIKDELTELETKREFGKERNKLVIQPTGTIVIEFLIKHFNSLFMYDYTKTMELNLDIIAKGNAAWYELCGQCHQELIQLSNNISVEDKTEIIIDKQHTYRIGKYGPVIQCKIDGKTSFKSIQKDIDIEKLKSGGYRLDEIVVTNDNNILGNYQNHDIVMKKGRYGLYVTWNGKNYSIKHLAKKKKITMKDVIPVFSKTNQNIIRILRDDLSIRTGKYGFYIFYKNPNKKKPDFLKLKGCPLNVRKSAKNDLLEWINEEYDV